MISNHTPDKILSTYWGDEELRIIQHKLELIKSDTEEVKKELVKITALEEKDWTSMPDVKKKRRAKFIWTKKKYLQKLINSVPKSMDTLWKAADRGWNAQQEGVYGGISNKSAYHTQVAFHLVRIASQMQHDPNALRMCTQALPGLSIELDLDMFDAIAARSEDVHAATVAEAAAAGHLRLDLLLRESNNPVAEMVRAKVERKRSPELPDVYSTANVAFRSVMTAQQASVYYFAHNTSTVFSIYKSVRTGDPCSPARESLRQKISSGKMPPSYDEHTNQLDPCTLILGELSTFRVAYELSQACLIFLRTTWISDLCQCGVQCGDRHHSTTDKWYEFGLNMDIAHQPPIWRNPYYLLGPENTRPMIIGESWCMNTREWNTLTRPIRRLGLLLLEIALGTSVSNTRNDANGAVTHVCLFLRGTPPRFFRKKSIRLEKALAVVAKAVHGSDGFPNAIRCCLTRTLDQMPFDDEWEDLLKDLYFDIVKP